MSSYLAFIRLAEADNLVVIVPVIHGKCRRLEIKFRRIRVLPMFGSNCRQ
jgi:hypothetical protein